MTSSGPDTIVRRADVVWRSVLGGVLIRRPAGAAGAGGEDVVGEDVLLEGTGVSLWQALAAPMSVTDLARQLADSHGASTELVSADLESALEHLASLGVVVRG